MNLDQEHIFNKIVKLNNIQLKLYTKALRSSLLKAGVDQGLVDSALKSSIQHLKETSSFQSDCQKTLCGENGKECPKDKRGIDSIGRILVEYCFIRTPEKRMIWPESSEQDKKARKVFTQEIIPRPLMIYFLISVRGTIPKLNKFEASSVLFGEENKTHEERKEYVDSLVEEFNTSTTSNVSTKWNQIYSDSRFQAAARDLIGDIRRKIGEFGLERYLLIIENLRQRDPESKRSNRMQRAFTIEDVKQLEDALWMAEEALAKPLA